MSFNSRNRTDDRRGLRRDERRRSRELVWKENLLFSQSVGSTKGPRDLSEALSYLQGRRQRDNGTLGLDVGAAPADTAAGFHQAPYRGRPSARWNALLSEHFHFLWGSWVIIPSRKRERGNKRCERGRRVLMCFVVSDAITAAVM